MGDIFDMAMQISSEQNWIGVPYSWIFSQFVLTRLDK